MCVKEAKRRKQHRDMSKRQRELTYIACRQVDAVNVGKNQRNKKNLTSIGRLPAMDVKGRSEPKNEKRNNIFIS